MADLAPVYLKLNRRSTVTTRCLQFWSDVWQDSGTQVFLLCDLSQEDVRRWVPRSLQGSVVVPSSPRIAEEIKSKLAPRWRNAGAAHMTTFDHAAANGIDVFWGIDADDTIFMHDPAFIRDKLVDVQRWAADEDVDCASLDFYQTYHRHWSFGITYTQMTKDYLSLVRGADLASFGEVMRAGDYGAAGKRAAELGLSNWRDDGDRVVNIDTVFSYLRDTGSIHARSFYFEDTYFHHAGLVEWHLPDYDAIGETLRGTYHWKNGYLWDDEIAADCVKF